jgi:hypothetical protein
LTSDQVRKRLAAMARKTSQRRLSKEIGCSVQFLNAILRGHKEPSGKPVAFLGLERAVIYRKVTIPVPCTCRHRADRELCQRKLECQAVETFAANLVAGHNGGVK